MNSTLARWLLILAVSSTVCEAASALPEADIDGIDSVAARWISSLQSEDVMGLRSTYWPDAVHIHIHEDGSREIKRGPDEILEGQQILFDSTDIFSQLEYPEPERDLRTDPAHPVYLFRMEQFGYSDRFTTERVSIPSIVP